MSKADDVQTLENDAATARLNNDPDLADKFQNWADFLNASPAIDDNASAMITTAILSNDSDLAGANLQAIADQIVAGQDPGRDPGSDPGSDSGSDPGSDPGGDGGDGGDDHGGGDHGDAVAKPDGRRGDFQP